MTGSACTWYRRLTWATCRTCTRRCRFMTPSDASESRREHRRRIERLWRRDWKDYQLHDR